MSPAGPGDTPPLRCLLFSTSACHLCDQAAGLLFNLDIPRDVRLQVVDVADDPALLDRYGEFIPVLRRRDNGAELFWPFDATAARDFLLAEP